MRPLHQFLRSAILAALCLLLKSGASGQDDPLSPSGPITNFAMPLYNEDGYRIWYLKGAQGIYENENQVKIEGLQIRQHAGDESDAVVSTAYSPAATFRRNDATVYGPGRLTLENDTFTLAGDDWIWAAKEDRINLNKKVRVTLFDSLSQTIGPADPSQSSPRATEIESDRLLLERTGDKAKFIFSGNVFLKSAELDLDSDQLEIYATQASDQGAIQRVLADGNVHIKQPGRLTTAESAEVLPLEEKIILTNQPRIEQDGLSVNGGNKLVINGRERNARFIGSANNKVEAIGPALENFGAAPQNADDQNLTPETQRQSTRIESIEVLVSQNEDGDSQFTFENDVILNATNLGLQAERLEAFAQNLQKADTLFGKEGAFNRIHATGNVHIAQAERTADANEAEILPQEEKIILAGNPRLQQTDTTVDGGEKLIINREKGIVEFIGTTDNQVHAVTSSMSDLGFTVVPPPPVEEEEETPEEPSKNSAKKTSKNAKETKPKDNPASKTEAAKKTEDATPSENASTPETQLASQTPPQPASIPSNLPPEPTRINSDKVVITNHSDHTVFQFLGQTAFRATNLALDCDQLQVFTTPKTDTPATAEPLGSIQRILATGNLKIKQEQRSATAGRALVLPLEEKIILSEDPKGQDLATGIDFEGQKITFDRKSGRLLIDPYPPKEEPIEQVVGPKTDPAATTPVEQTAERQTVEPATPPKVEGAPEANVEPVEEPKEEPAKEPEPEPAKDEKDSPAKTPAVEEQAETPKEEPENNQRKRKLRKR